MPIDPVVEGEVIETAWGNDVADTINAMEAAMATDAELAAAIAVHAGLADPHPGYTTAAELAVHAAINESHKGSYTQQEDAVGGQFVLLASGSLAAQYHRSGAVLEVMSKDVLQATVFFRVHQGAAFGNQPTVTIQVRPRLGLVPTDFSIVVTSVAGPTTFGLYGRHPAAYNQLGVVPVAIDGTALVWASNSPVIAARPAGTQYAGAAQRASANQAAVGTAAPAGGVGVAAGGWSTAANRDTAIATINSLVTLTNELRQALIDAGIIKGAA